MVRSDHAPDPHEDRSAAVIGSTRSRDAEFTVAPEGGAFEVNMHAGSICVFSFPGEVLESSALTSSTDIDVKPWGERPYRHRDRVAVFASGEAKMATVALATRSGRIKVNVTISVVPTSEPALTFVTFKAATAAERLSAQLDREVEKRVAPLAEELQALRRRMDLQMAASPARPGSCRR